MADGSVDRLLAATADVAAAAGALRPGLGPPVRHVYNPLAYAWPVHEAYIRRYGGGPKEALFVGMNPGPWGMVQTGIPFGDPHVVTEWLGLSGAVGAPPEEELHEKRPVAGLASRRREVSGTRLYGLAREAFGGIESFFARFWIANAVPLAFFDVAGRNLTPPGLRAADRQAVEAVTDAYLRAVIAALRPRTVVGIGVFAEARLGAAVASLPGAARPRVGRILHPSPASPAANRGWADAALRDLAALGLAP